MGWFRRRRNRQELPRQPHLIYRTRAEVEAAEAKMVAAGMETTFRSHYQGESAYFAFQGDDAEKARRWLLDQSITERLRYYVVETPDGNWGKDIDGLYLEELRPWQYDTDKAECSGLIVALPEESAISSAARGKIDNFVAEVACGKCSFTWHDGLRYKNVTAVRCPACQALNSIDTGDVGHWPIAPLIQIVETHTTASEPGHGVRTCHRCDTRWHSLLGELVDSGEWERLKARGETSITASWESTIGLTCRGCDRSLCMAHAGEPDPTGDVPQVDDYRCPFCGDPMSPA